MHTICKELIVNGAYEVHTMWTRVLLPYSSDSVVSRETLLKVVPFKPMASTPDALFHPRTMIFLIKTNVSCYHITLATDFP